MSFDTDFKVENHGSIILLVPRTEAAAQWVDENIGQDNGYQPYYPMVVVEHRFIEDILMGLSAAGLGWSQ